MQKMSIVNAKRLKAESDSSPDDFMIESGRMHRLGLDESDLIFLKDRSVPHGVGDLSAMGHGPSYPS